LDFTCFRVGESKNCVPFPSGGSIGNWFSVKIIQICERNWIGNVDSCKGLWSNSWSYWSLYKWEVSLIAVVILVFGITWFTYKFFVVFFVNIVS
jgi:hypothetical protein